ncbi:MAG: MFS transporter [Tissierellia bacterium]|jgi:sugar phosphate permease|nr:MFS transporter [Tissierellia bacterium]
MNDKDKIKKVESYRWVVWTILALLYVFVTFHRMGTGVVRNELEEDFSIGAAQFANIGSMYFYAYFIMQIPSGILADKFGPKITVTIFSLLAAAGSVIFGLAPVINIAYMGRFLVGIGVSVVFICLIKIQSRWFYSKNFGLMIGFAGLAANVGAVLAQTPLVYAANRFGWRKTFVFMGFAMILFSVLTALFVKNDPRDMGLPSMDELEKRPVNSSKISTMQALKSVLSNPKTWIISFAYIGLYTGYVVLLGTFGVSFLMHTYNISKTQAANYVISAVAGSAAGGIVLGYISDLLKNRKTILIISSALTLILWIILIFTTMPLSFIYLFLFIFGFVMTAFTMCWTLGNEVNDRRFSGIATGVVNCIGFFGAAVIPVIMGRILDINKNMPDAGYKKAFLVLIILVAASFIATFFTSETGAENIYGKNKGD